MALSLDDRLLGEKVHNYCSSSSGSEDEGGDSDGEEKKRGDGGGIRRGGVQDGKAKSQQQPQPQPPPEPRDWRGSAANTGPKGVVADWRRFKQLEAEARALQEAERLALAARFSTTCRTAAEDAAEAELDAELEAAMSEVDAEFLANYRQQRLDEMRRSLAQTKLFGSVASLDRGSFLQAVDGEPADVKVVVHIFDSGEEPACVAVNAALDSLAARYPTVKFCRIPASQAAVSRRFVERGLPAIVVYKAGEVTNSFVGLVKEIGEACTSDELEAFLTEYGVLSEAILLDGQTIQQLLKTTSSTAAGQSSCGGAKIRGPVVGQTAGSDSDSD